MRTSAHRRTILSAVGLELDVLFPERTPSEHRYPGKRRPFNAWDVLAAIAHEMTCAAIVLCDIAKRGSATDAERKQLLELAGRLNERAEVARGC